MGDMDCFVTENSAVSHVRQPGSSLDIIRGVAWHGMACDVYAIQIDTHIHTGGVAHTHMSRNYACSLPAGLPRKATHDASCASDDQCILNMNYILRAFSTSRGVFVTRRSRTQRCMRVSTCEQVRAIKKT